jgi:ribonuclease E
MLDNDESTISTTTDTPEVAAPAKKAARAARPRKAVAPAASADSPSDAVAAGAAGPAPRKRTRKAAAPAVQPELAASSETLSQPTMAAEKSPEKPAKKAARPRKAPAKAAATEAVVDDAGESGNATPPRRTRKAGPAKSTPTADASTPDVPAPAMAAPSVLFQAPALPEVAPRKRARKAAAPALADEIVPADAEVAEELEGDEVREAAIDEANGARRRRRRGRRGRGRQREDADAIADSTDADPTTDADADAEDAPDEDAGVDADGEDAGTTTAARRRRRRRRADATDGDGGPDDPPNTVVHVRERRPEGAADDGVRGVKGSTRLEAKRQRRRDGRDSGRRRPSILSEAEFLARRESVDRVMAVRQAGDRTQIAVLEDGVLVEHYVTRASATSYVGNVYLGRVQNVLPSMEAAFVDIGKGRNGVLYAGEVNWDAAGLEGKSRAIENAMGAGDTVLVQVTKDPIGHKGARLTSQVSLPGRFLVYVPGGGMTGISRKLPDTERQRLKAILKKIVPEDAGVIIRTAAEGATEEELTHDVERLKAEWESISAKSEQKKNAPALVHGEPDLATRVVRDVFNEDFNKLIVQGDEAWQTVSSYLADVAPELGQRASRHTADTDLFHDLRVDEGLAKALDRKVWLPSGGSLVIDRTEAMTVVDVNTGKFVGSGGNLEQTVTRNNLEAAEEIVRQLRLRDVGGIVVIDFIDMVLESNRDLVLRRLTECLGRDRTKHQVAEVTSLGLVQMTRKRVGEGLLEAFSEPCEVCRGRGVIIHTEPVDQKNSDEPDDDDRPAGRKRGSRRGGGSAPKAAVEEPVHIETPEEAERRRAAATAMAAIHRAASAEGEELSDALAEAASALEEGQRYATERSIPDEQVLPDEAVTELAVPSMNGVAPALADPALADPAPSEAELPSDAEPAAPVRRRRRAASRPAGPPVAAS